MKKGDQLALLTCAVAALYVSYPTLSSHLSEISKAILLMLCSFVCLSVALLVTLAWRDTLSTTKIPGGSNRLARLAAAEKRIAARGKTTTSDRDIADYKNFMEDR